jgi:NADP-dependent 3-hydroxy acid dehydrogenase YdfG
MAHKFKNQVIWITGASSGIGAALATEFIREGATVALSARRHDRLHNLCQSLGDRAHVFVLDVQDKAAVDHTAQQIFSKLGKLDGVVANAGYSVVGSLESLSEQVWRQQFETNVFGVVWTLQAAIPFLRQTQGRIGIVSSVVGKIALANSAAYSASKFALTAIANSLYQELYSSGVSVTNIAPGWVDSEIFHIDNLGQPKAKPNDINTFGLRWPSSRAARAILNALYLRKREEVITGHGKLAAFFGTYLAPITYWGLAKANKAVASKN